MRILLAPALALVAAAPLPAAPTPAAPISSADARFAAIWQAEWAWRQTERIADSEAGGVDAHLPDVSAAAHARRQAYWADVMRKLDALGEGKLSPEARVDYQVYRAQIASALEDERFREWQKPVNGDSAFWSDLHYVARGDFNNGERDYRAYLTWLADIPRYFDQQTANMRAGLARGFTPPAVVMTGREKAVETIATAADPTRTVYYEPFAKLPAAIPAARQAELRAAAKRVIADRIIPAHRTLLAFLRTTYFPGLTRSLAASDYPDGAGVLSQPHPRLHHARHDARRDPRARPGGGRQDPRRDGGDPQADRVQGRSRRLPDLSAHRSALLRQDPRSIAQAGRMARQKIRRDGREMVRSAAAQPLRGRPRASRYRAVLHRRARRAGRCISSIPTICRHARCSNCPR